MDMLTFVQSSIFQEWLAALAENRAKAIIAGRINRAALGNFGDSEAVGDGAGFEGQGTAMSKITYSAFDAAEYLDNEEVIAEYLNDAAQDENPDVLLRAMADVAKARGMAQVARDAGLGRESLYKTLKPGAKPRHETVKAILGALNVRLAVQVK